MNVLKLLTMLLMCFLIVSGCGNTVTGQQDITAIKTLLLQQQKAWNNGDIEGYMQGYVQSDTLRFASGGTVRRGWTATLNGYKRGYPDKTSMGTLQFSNIQVTLFSETSAAVFGSWQLDRKHDRPSGLFTLLLCKTAGTWRIWADHTSSAKE